MALTGTFASLGVLSVLSALVVYLICCLATIQMRRKNIHAEGALPFRVPGGPVIPVLASAMVISLMTSSTRQEFVAISIELLVISLLFFGMRLRRRPVPTLS